MNDNCRSEMSENDTYTVFDTETQQPLTVTVAQGGADDSHGTIQYITQDGVQIQQITQPGGEIVQVYFNWIIILATNMHVFVFILAVYVTFKVFLIFAYKSWGALNHQGVCA